MTRGKNVVVGLAVISVAAIVVGIFWFGLPVRDPKIVFAGGSFTSAFLATIRG